MSNNEYSLAVKPVAPIIKLDRKNRKELVQQANRITRIAEVSRAAMNEITTNYVVAEQLAAQALTTSHVIQHTTPQTSGSQAYHNTLTQQYLQRMVTIANTANDAIGRNVANQR